MALLKLASLSIAIAGQRPIAGLDLTLDDGAALAIVGRSSTGKSLLAQAIAGLLPDGAVVEGAGLPSRRVGLIGPTDDESALARWLARGAKLLACDEPGRALAPDAQRELLTALLAANRDRGTGLLIFTRDFRLPLAMGLETAILDAGALVERGPASELLEHPRETATRELTVANKPRTRTMARPPIGEPLLELHGIAKRFADPASRLWHRKPAITALEDVTFSVRRGEAVGILGGPGAGKSLLLKLVAGLGRVSFGQMAFDRQSYRGNDLRREARSRISFLFPDPHAAFNPDLPVGLSLTEPLRVEEQLLIDEQADRLVEAVRVVGMEPNVLDQLPGMFSPAELQRLALARALVGRPSLIVLDEPTAMLDTVEQAEFLVLFNRVRSDYGLAVLCASREFEVLRALADRIHVLDHGYIVESGKPIELLETGQHPATRALLAPRYPTPPTGSTPEPALDAPATPATEPPAKPEPATPVPESEPSSAADDGPNERTERGQVEPPVDGSGDRARSVDAPHGEAVG